MTWFRRITGFNELSYPDVQARLKVCDGRLVSPHSERRPLVGRLETPSLRELRARTGALTRPPGGRPGSLEHRRGDVRKLHADPANAQALFQVASQFNLLEMVGSSVTPEDGVTRYEGDRTQGPACAMAAGGGTIYRNYLLPLPGGIGQTAGRQVDCLADLGRALGNDDERLWMMRNGYALFTASGISEIDERLAACSAEELDALRAQLRIGVHHDVEVTDVRPVGHVVSQAFCSALPVAYQREGAGLPWARFASLVLEAAYEATLLAGILNLERTGCPLVYLTRLGDGAFGNAPAWIDAAISHALERVGDRGLRVVMVSYG